jgi:hypothetical protein
MYLEQPAKHELDARTAELVQEFVADFDLANARSLVRFARYCARVEADRDRLRAALALMSLLAEQQNLLMPLHEQRQINEALGV